MLINQQGEVVFLSTLLFDKVPPSGNKPEHKMVYTHLSPLACPYGHYKILPLRTYGRWSVDISSMSASLFDYLFHTIADYLLLFFKTAHSDNVHGRCSLVGP
jgi:hypothetical protein